jgi:hypothetical protein
MGASASASAVHSGDVALCNSRPRSTGTGLKPARTGLFGAGFAGPLGRLAKSSEAPAPRGRGYRGPACCLELRTGGAIGSY